MRWARRAALVTLLAGVAVAFADSSIVVLALPDLLSQFDVSIGVVAWVVTAYNLALAASALALIRYGPRFDHSRLALLGAAAFLVSSIACAVAPEIWSLIAFRSVQGLGATLLLLGALPLVRGLAATPERGSALWTGVGVFGAALGPALGGMLTEAFSWRAIFYAQAPVAALAVVAALRVRVPAFDSTPAPAQAGQTRRRRAAGAALGLTSAALVGLLFLAVVQLIDVWRLSPLAAGAVVTAIPLATLAAIPFAHSARTALLVAGSILLAGGLAGMAFVPGKSIGWVIAALALAGFGYGLLVPNVSKAALAGRGSPVAGGALTISLRHLGLVAGLLVLTPLLASDLTSAGDKAQLRGIEIVLDAPSPAKTKLALAVDLAPVLASPASKGLPDFSKALAAKGNTDASGLGRRLDAAVAATITRAFRRSFLAAAIFALLAALPIALMAARRVVPARARAILAVSAAVAAVLVGAELAAGALDYGNRPPLYRACADRPQVAASGSDEKTQRLVFSGVDLLACRLHQSREELVAGAAKNGVDAAHFVDRIVRYARLLARIPGLG